MASKKVAPSGKTIYEMLQETIIPGRTASENETITEEELRKRGLPIKSSKVSTIYDLVGESIQNLRSRPKEKEAYKEGVNIGKEGAKLHSKMTLIEKLEDSIYKSMTNDDVKPTYASISNWLNTTENENMVLQVYAYTAEEMGREYVPKKNDLIMYCYTMLIDTPTVNIGTHYTKKDVKDLISKGKYPMLHSAQMREYSKKIYNISKPQKLYKRAFKSAKSYKHSAKNAHAEKLIQALTKSKKSSSSTTLKIKKLKNKTDTRKYRKTGKRTGSVAPPPSPVSSPKINNVSESILLQNSLPSGVSSSSSTGYSSDFESDTSSERSSTSPRSRKNKSKTRYSRRY